MISQYRGWVMLAGVFLAWFMIGGVQTYTLFLAPWGKEFGWSLTVMSFAASVQYAVNGLFGPVGGRLADRFGTKRIFLGYLLILGFGALGVSRMSSVWQLVLFQGVMFGLASGLSPVYSPLLARWFPRHRGMAFAIAPSGHHLGRGAFAPIVVSLIAIAGWRVPWLLMGSLILLTLIPFVLWTFRDYPENPPSPQLSVGRPSWGSAAGSPPSGTRDEGAAVLEAVRTSPFWLIFAGFLVCGSTAQPITVHLAPLAMEGGLGQAETAAALGIFGISALLGLLTSGAATQTIGGRGTLATYYLSRAVGFLMLLFFVRSGNPWLLYLASGIIGFFGRGTDPAVRTLLANCYGVRSLGTLVGMVLLIHQLGSAFWIFMGGYLFQHTGTYSGFLITSVVMLVIASIISCYIRERRCYPVTEEKFEPVAVG
ncbi:MAG: MFS transporter [Deltaproteobacteria bacterium]|nr:MFS transporter [Deltaproteobacteria bacterium]